MLSPKYVSAEGAEYLPLSKLRMRVRFSSPAPGLISLQRSIKSLQTLLLAFATVRHYFLLFATSHCRATVATLIMAVNHAL